MKLCGGPTGEWPAYNALMITRIQSVQLFVSDQDRAKDFFISKLGFTERMDAPMGPDNRWVELGPPGGGDTSLVVMKPMEGMPSNLGGYAHFIFTVDDIQATHKELTAKGVEFQDVPSKQEWGWWATLKDPDGNIIGLHQ